MILINQLPILLDVTPAESILASLGSFSWATFSGPPPDGSGEAFVLKLSINEHIVKEIDHFPENIQVSALQEMLSRLEKCDANE